MKALELAHLMGRCWGTVQPVWNRIREATKEFDLRGNLKKGDQHLAQVSALIRRADDEYAKLEKKALDVIKEFK